MVVVVVVVYDINRLLVPVLSSTSYVICGVLSKYLFFGSLNFSHHERVVNEVTRGITDRSEYEKVSRQIRYDFYKDVLQSDLKATMETGGGLSGGSRSGDGFLMTSESTGEQRACGVIFGHHVGDVQENVLSNMMR